MDAPTAIATALPFLTHTPICEIWANNADRSEPDSRRDHPCTCGMQAAREALETAALFLRKSSGTMEETARELLAMLVAADEEAKPNGIQDCVDNDGHPYQSAYMAGLITHARMLVDPHRLSALGPPPTEGREGVRTEARKLLAGILATCSVWPNMALHCRSSEALDLIETTLLSLSPSPCDCLVREAVEGLFANGFVEAGLRGEPDQWKQEFETRTNALRTALQGPGGEE